MAHTPQILLVEDDEDLREGLSFALEHEGYSVSVATRIAEAETLLARRSMDLIILDVMLPDGSGFDLCRRLRDGLPSDGAETPTAGAPPGAAGTSGRAPDGSAGAAARNAGAAAPNAGAPVIFLTARDDEIDVVRGLDLGGDDYVTKPFRLRELLSRVQARLRRAGEAPPDADEPRRSEDGGDSGTAPLSIDRGRAEVRRHGRAVPLTATEYRLLLALAENPGQTLTRDRLMDRIMGIEDAAVDDNTLSVYIRRLREKLEEDPASPAWIVTVRGLGYRYEDGTEPSGYEGPL